MAQADKAGWRLIAGEESAVVAAGTLADVENSDAMRRMLNEPRALGEGVGCWIITAPDGVEYRSGQFDANAWW
jgi:hypothetical protein